MKSTVSRRRFLKTAVAAGAPLIIPASALGRSGHTAPSNRIVMGCIGVGGMGTSDMRGFLQKPVTQVVAVCDVDTDRREAARAIVEEHYAEKAPGGSYKGCDGYNDFRELIARGDIDAVVIATPDHWHVLIAMAAARAGKDMYCEKPLSLTIAQGRALSDCVKQYGRVFQTGSQLRSSQNTRFACELVRNGRIGELKTIYTYCTGGPTIGPQPKMPIPDGFDYDMWLGPAPWAPYTEMRCHWNYRWLYDYSGGKLTDLGAHDNDIAQWGNGTEYTGPVEIEAQAEYPKDGLWNTAVSYRVEYTYANGVKLVCADGGGKTVTFEGTEGRVTTRGGPIEADPPSILNSRIGPNEIHLYDSRDHHQNFLDCVRSRAEPIAPAEVAHRSVTVCHLGNIAMQLGRKLHWDPDCERFVNDPEADRYLTCAMRAPWELPG
jgi:predicted dehydrogenase